MRIKLFVFLFGVNLLLFAQDRPVGPYVYFPPIPGASSNPTDNAIITRMIIQELQARSLTMLDSPQGAHFLMYGSLTHYDEFHYSLRDEPPATNVYSYNAAQQQQNPWAPQFILQLNLRNATTNELIVRQSLIFTNIEGVYYYFPAMMHNLLSQISNQSSPRPQPTFPQPVHPQPVYPQPAAPAPPPLPPAYPPVERPRAPEPPAASDAWRNQSVYLRASVNFPVTFFTLLPDGLIGKTGVYRGEDTEDPDFDTAPIDNRVFALPAVTLGFELQFQKWSLEPKLLIGWESMNDTDYASLEAGVELKFPIKKIDNVMLEPYGAITFPIPTFTSTSQIYDSYPAVAIGGGFQLGVKGSSTGIFFVDINYMYYIDPVGVKNNYGELFPNPSVIKFQRSVIGLALGYKIGTFDRSQRTQSSYWY